MEGRMLTKEIIEEFNQYLLNEEKSTNTIEKYILSCAKGTDLFFLIYLLIHTGMRRGELLGLRWKDFHIDKDEEHPYIDIVQTRLNACGMVKGIWGKITQYIFSCAKQVDSYRVQFQLALYVL